MYKELRTGWHTVECSINTDIIIRFVIWLGGVGLTSESSIPTGLLGLSSHRGLKSWGKLPEGHICIPLGLGPLLPCPQLPSCLRLSPFSSLGGSAAPPPPLTQRCWQLSKQADHSIPFFLPFLLVLLILNTARHFAWFIIWNEHSPKALY